MALSQIPSIRAMKTNITDLALLGTSVTAGFSGLVNDYGGFLVTLGGALLLGVIRWNEHRANMRLLKLDEELKRKQLQE